MSLEKDAVVHIQNSANIPVLIEQLADKETQIPTIIVPERYTVQDLEKYMPNASRYRLHFATSCISDYVAYSLVHSNSGSGCFVEVDSMSALAVYDLGSVDIPGHKEHKSTISLKKTAAYKALLEVDGRQLGQKEAAEFIEDWCDNMIIFTSAGDNLKWQSAAARLRDMTIEAAREVGSQVGDFGESMSQMDRIEAKGKDTIPSAFEFTCEPYLGLDTRKFKMRLSILTGGDRPKIVFRILKLESQKEEMAEEFKDILEDAFRETDMPTYIGTV